MDLLLVSRLEGYKNRKLILQVATVSYADLHKLAPIGFCHFAAGTRWLLKHVVKVCLCLSRSGILIGAVSVGIN